MFLLAGDLLNGVTAFTGGFIGFDAGVMRSEIDDIHRSATTRFRASQMLVLERLDKSVMSFAFLIGFHFF